MPRTPSKDISLTRIYDAPVKTVWDAWTDLAQVAQWWGPRGFTITTHSKDLRNGGSWHYTMHGPDGTDYENTTKYLEVVPCAKLVYDHGGHADRPPLFRVTALFSAVGEQTKLQMTMSFDTPELAESSRQFIKKASGESTWDRLAEYLTETKAGQTTFVINRSFDAPVERLFAMWTDPRHLAAWLPPTGAEMTILEGEIKVGTGVFWRMSGAHGVMYGRTHYLTIEAPSRLVYTQAFCDERKGPARHPMAPLWPETMLTTVLFTAEGADRARVTVTWAPHGTCTAEEIAEFAKGRAGMTMGWTGSFDKLEALLGG